MLSSRSHLALFHDKENGASSSSLSSTGMTSRKGATTYTSQQAMGFKTPGFKQVQSTRTGGNANKAGGGKGKDSAMLLQTVGMEPGARVLGAKDGNNKQQQRLVQTAMKDKGKQKENSSGEMIAPKVLFKDGLSLKADGPHSKLQPSKTPAKVAASKPAGQASFKTPSLTARKAVRTPKAAPPTAIQSFSIYQTPSPGQLKRRRSKVGGLHSPPGFHLDGFVKPAGLRDEDDLIPEEQMEAVEEVPTLLDLLQAHLDGIDEEQEVELAGSSALDYHEPYSPDFDMPDYGELGIADACFLPALRMPYHAAPEILETHIDLDDEAAFAVRCKTLEELEPPLFPELARAHAHREPTLSATVPRAGTARRAPLSASISTTASARTRPLSATPSLARAALSSRSTSRGTADGGAAARPLSSSTAPTSRMHSRTGSTASAASPQAFRSLGAPRTTPRPQSAPLEGLENQPAFDTYLNLNLD